MPTRQPFIKPQELFLSSLWWIQLKETVSEAEVVSLTREFLAAWTPEQLAGVPADARPGRINSGDDIRELALSLEIKPSQNLVRRPMGSTQIAAA